MADSLARGLSKYRLFLQHPTPKPPGLEYVNPQYLTMAGSYLPNGAVLAPIPMDAFDLDASRRNDVDQDPEDEVDLKAVMDNLPQHAYLRDADIDGRVNATLLKFVHLMTHQAGIAYKILTHMWIDTRKRQSASSCRGRRVRTQI
jgi:hypothetical protein